ncbi:twin-arginine translocation pathway signal protein [Comamonas thiooxydans]|nr:twin-arginine translocation pathway signal protein [Comamonas thiooxydans]
MIKRREWMKAAGFATLSLGTVRSVKAQPVPKLLKIINGFPPGGVVDAVARRVAEGLAVTEPGVNVIVDNRVGAGGRIAVSAVKAAVDDGSTLLFTPDAVLSLYPFVYSKLDYDPFADLAPVATVATTTDALALGPLVPPSVRGLRDFLAWAKEHPEHASFGSPGTGTPLHLLGALVAKEAGVYLRHVAYRGAAPGVTDLIVGRLHAWLRLRGRSCLSKRRGNCASSQPLGRSEHPSRPTLPHLQSKSSVQTTPLAISGSAFLLHQAFRPKPFHAFIKWLPKPSIARRLRRLLPPWAW